MTRRHRWDTWTVRCSFAGQSDRVFPTVTTTFGRATVGARVAAVVGKEPADAKERCRPAAADRTSDGSGTKRRATVFLSGVRLNVSQVKIPTRVSNMPWTVHVIVRHSNSFFKHTEWTSNSLYICLLLHFIFIWWSKMCVNEGWRGGAYVVYILKMWYSCFAQFSGIKCLAQTFPLTKIKFSNRNACLSVFIQTWLEGKSSRSLLQADFRAN